MKLGNLIVGAGAVAGGYREQEAAIRKAREDQLRLQALNRSSTADRQQREYGLGYTPPVEVPTDEEGFAVGTRPIARAAAKPVIAPGVKVAQNPTTTLNPKVKVASAPAPEELGMTQQDFLALPEHQQQALLQQWNDRRGLKSLGFAAGTLPVAGAEVLGVAPIRGLGMIGQELGNSRFGQAVGLSDPGKPLNFVDENASFPLTNYMAKGVTSNMLPGSREDFIKTLPIRQSGTDLNRPQR